MDNFWRDVFHVLAVFVLAFGIVGIAVFALPPLGYLYNRWATWWEKLSNNPAREKGGPQNG